MEKIKWLINNLPKTQDKQLQVMSLENVASARAFHESFPQYTITPLAKLNNMARRFGIAALNVKDESYRFGLNAFKVLGGSFAMAKYIAGKTGRSINETNYNYLTSSELLQQFGKATFFTATDGNHGRGIAWAANKLGQNAVVLMPKGSTKPRFDNIEKEGAKVSIEQVNYDECVRMANAQANATENGVMVQDTAWNGYEEIPSWIMQGYGTMASEAASQMKEIPTHIFIQAGVGSLAGAVQGYFANLYPQNPPKVIVIEAMAAACLYESAKAADGAPYAVDGDLQTIMAGLACGEANTIAWDILKNHAFAFVSCPDWVAAKGMRMLAAPEKGDTQVISGESGAVGMGLIAAICENPEYADFKKALQINSQSKILMFSTEGDTDPENYRRIVHDGAVASI